MLKQYSVLLLCLLVLLCQWAVFTSAEETSELPAVSEEVSDVTPSTTETVAAETTAHPSTLSVSIGGQLTEDTLTVTVTDSLGYPVAGMPMTFDIAGNAAMRSGETDTNGQLSIPIVGLEPATAIVCHATGFTANGTTYLSADYALSLPGTATTKKTTAATTASAAATTLATLPTLPSTDGTTATKTLTTYAEVRGATTTAVHKDEIQTNLFVDEHLLSQFGLDIQRFDQVGRLVLDKSAYDSLTETYGARLFGKLTTSELSEVTTDQIKTAAKSVKEFSACNPEKAKALTFAVSLQFLDENDAGLSITDAASIGSDTIFEFRLPVPKSMKKCKSFGVAMTGEGALATLTPVTVADEVITFRTTALGHFTLVGFPDGVAAASDSGSSLNTLVILLLIGGILCLLAMGFLIFWFFIRPRKQNAPTDETENEPVSEPDDAEENDETEPEDTPLEEDTAAQQPLSETQQLTAILDDFGHKRDEDL